MRKQFQLGFNIFVGISLATFLAVYSFMYKPQSLLFDKDNLSCDQVTQPGQNYQYTMLIKSGILCDWLEGTWRTSLTLPGSKIYQQPLTSTATLCSQAQNVTGKSQDLLVLKNGAVCVCPLIECSKTQWINTSIGLRGAILIKDKNVSNCNFSRVYGQKGDTLIVSNGQLCSCSYVVCQGNWTDDNMTIAGPRGVDGNSIKVSQQNVSCALDTTDGIVNDTLIIYNGTVCNKTTAGTATGTWTQTTTSIRGTKGTSIFVNTDAVYTDCNNTNIAGAYGDVVILAGGKLCKCDKTSCAAELTMLYQWTFSGLTFQVSAVPLV